MTSGSFAPDYVGCHIKVAATFAAVSSLSVPTCEDGTVFAALDGATASEAQRPVMVCVPKANANVLFELKVGEPITIVGGSWDMAGSGEAWGLRADSVDRAR